MAKTRMLKHDLRTSEKVASWPVPLRYFWVLLWGYVDDHGKGKDNPQLIKADCFPLDDDITADQIDTWLDRFMIDGVVARYTVDGARYLKVINWTEHQKPPHPSPEKFPDPDAPGAVARVLHASLMNDAGATPATFTSGLGWVGFGLKGGDADAAQEPPLFCSTHPTGFKGKCGPCGDARRLHEYWERQQTDSATAALSARPLPWDPETHCEHGQLIGKCDACEQEARVASNVLRARFGDVA